MSRFVDQIWADVSQRTVLFPYEAGVLLLTTVLFALLGANRGWLHAAGSFYQRIARHRRWCVVVVFALGYMGHWVELRYVIPAAGFHDEFSYLLAADTFANGRLTNPAHPMRYFFESIHTLSEPTYMSMYPPGQGLMLAAGQVLAGNPIFGVWLSTALCCASICWMLQGWTTPGWALTGGLISVARIGWFSYWAHSYWGGSVAAFGGAILLGTIPRMIRRPTPVLGCGFALAVLILINTRLLEGTILVITAVSWLAVTQRHRLKQPFREGMGRFALPAALLIAGFGCMAFYNWRITGHPLRLPYLENRHRYEVNRSFYWQPTIASRVYNHEVIRRFYEESEAYNQLYPYWYSRLEKVETGWLFFIGPALTLPLLASFRSVSGSRLRLIWLTLVTFFAAHTLVTWRLQPHYAAPITGAVYIICVEGLRRLTIWRRDSRYRGQLLQRAVIATVAIMVMLRIAAPSAGIPVYQEQSLPWYSYGLGANFARTKMEEKLTSLGGSHLVLVQYSPAHSPEGEWVYNRADIDGSPVVWARHVTDRMRLQQLLDYYHDRQIWIVFPDNKPNQIFDFRENYR